MPDKIPSLDRPLREFASMSYQETAYEVMKLFLTDFTEEELKSCISRAYDSKFDTEEIAPLVKADGAYYLELFHGSTIAFKDMALSILPHLIRHSGQKKSGKGYHRNPYGYFRRYGKGRYGRLRRCGRDKNHCFLS